MSRQVRVETRSRHQNDLKRVMHSTEKVRKWEKKWVRIEETSLQIFKWMPITKNEEQHKQQLQQQISAPVSTDTLITTSQEASYSHESDSKRNQENIQSQSTRDEKSHGGAMPISATLSATTSTKMNGSGDARKMSEPSLGAAMNSLSPSTLHSINPNKRLHEGSDEANESINSPNSKRIKTAAETLTTTGTTQLVDSRSTLVSMHGADPVSSPAPQTIPQPQLSHPSRNAMNETSHHIQLAAETSPRTQQHVQPSTTATPATNDEVAAKLTTPNGSVDIEMMDAEESSGHIELPEQQHQQQQPTTQPLSVVSDMTDTLMEDFSSIVRNVTEQIVIKVSDCYGGDN